MATNLRYEKIRLDRVDASRIIGEYYRALSMFFAGYGQCPTIRPLNLSSIHGKNLVKRAKNQNNGILKKNKNGIITITCDFCNRTFLIYDIDQHENQCEKHT